MKVVYVLSRSLSMFTVISRDLGSLPDVMLRMSVEGDVTCVEITMQQMMYDIAS